MQEQLRKFLRDHPVPIAALRTQSPFHYSYDEVGSPLLGGLTITSVAVKTPNGLSILTREPIGLNSGADPVFRSFWVIPLDLYCNRATIEK